MHDAVRVRVVMVEPKGVAELVDCSLRRPFDELVPSVVPEPRDRDSGKPVGDGCGAEAEVQAAIEEVHVGRGEDAVPEFLRERRLEVGRLDLDVPGSLPPNEGVRYRGPRREPDRAE